jgi:hypothetical protein
MRYIEGLPRNAPDWPPDEHTRPVNRKWHTRIGVYDRISAPDSESAIRILTSRLAAAGFTFVIDSGKAAEAVEGGLEDYEVEVQRMVTTTVKVRAQNETSAARQVDNTSFPLPQNGDDWEGIEGYTYIVRKPGDGEILYEGDCGEFT